MVVVDGTGRKSLVVPTPEAAEKLRADLQQALTHARGPSLADALAEYRTHLQRVRGATTAPSITRAIERFLGSDTQIATLSPARAAALYEAETRRVLPGKGRPVASDSHRTLLGQCKRFFAWAVERGYIAQSPFARVKPVGRPKVGKPQLRIDEARRFLALATERAQAGDRAALGAMMALLLGMRAGEVLGRIVRDLDDAGRILWITRGKTDNARRRLAVPDLLRPLLLRVAAGRPPTDYLLGASPHAPARPLSDAWLWGHIQLLCKQAGVPRISTHSLRGLHSTLALEAGATADAVAAALGHGSFDITARHYAAPGPVDRIHSKAVAQALQDPSSPPVPVAAPDLTRLDPNALAQAVQRLSPDQRAALRAALREPSDS